MAYITNTKFEFENLFKKDLFSYTQRDNLFFIYRGVYVFRYVNF